MSDQLTRDDLVLLMESYRNMITMHQTILDQTSKTIERMDNIASKQDSLFFKQGNICNELQKITGNLDIVNKNNENLNLKSTSIEKQLNDHEKITLNDHNKIINKIHLGWIGMGTIIISLLTLIKFLHIPLP